MSDNYIHDPDRVDEILEAYRKAKVTQNFKAQQKLKEMFMKETLGLTNKLLHDRTFADELSDDELIERWLDCWDEDGIADPDNDYRTLQYEVEARDLTSRAFDSLEQDSST